MSYDRQTGIDADFARDAMERMRIMTICEDRLTGLLAKRLFDYISDVMEQDYEIHRMLWDFDALAGPAAIEDATRSARSADMVLIAAYGHGDWPPAVKSWLERWAGEGTRRHGGLALLLLRLQADASVARRRRASLEKVARHSKRSYFFAEVWIGGPEYRSVVRMAS